MIDPIIAFLREIVFSDKKNKVFALIILIVLLALLGQPILKSIYANASDIESQSNTLQTLVNLKDKVIDDTRLYNAWGKILGRLEESLDKEKYAIINVGNTNINNAISNKYIQISISLVVPLIILISGIFAKQKTLWSKILAILICFIYLCIVGYISIIVPTLINQVITGIISLIIQISLIVLLYRNIIKK